ncbi:S8 family serine peptidase [Methanosarcina sp. WH1]|uniref:S8 family serine peptidase n=1 Tax=Methanosarcina sp. WH1 TaxID=1434102 RepID=UPI00350F41BF
MGVIGVAPETNLYAQKILDSTGSGSSGNIIAAIDWAIATHDDGIDSNEIQIISMSPGSDSGTETLNSACTLAYEHGILLVAAVFFIFSVSNYFIETSHGLIPRTSSTYALKISATLHAWAMQPPGV